MSTTANFEEDAAAMLDSKVNSVIGFYQIHYYQFYGIGLVFLLIV